MDFIKWENLQFLRKVGSLGSTPKKAGVRESYRVHSWRRKKGAMGTGMGGGEGEEAKVIWP